MNKSDFLNSLRDETIREYLDADKNRSSFIAHQIRKSVANFEGVTDPTQYEQLNDLELRNVNATVNEIKTKLLDYFNNLTTLSNDKQYESTRYSELYNKVGNYTSILIDYNKLISLYLSTKNNAPTQQKIYSTLMETKDLYLQLGNLTLRILIDYDQISDAKRRRITIIKYFVKILLLLSLFYIINKQFQSNSFSIISENFILTNIEISLPEQLKRVLREFSLKPELYGIPTPPPGGGFPPPRPPPVWPVSACLLLFVVACLCVPCVWGHSRPL